MSQQAVSNFSMKLTAFLGGTWGKLLRQPIVKRWLSFSSILVVIRLAGAVDVRGVKLHELETLAVS